MSKTERNRVVKQIKHPSHITPTHSQTRYCGLVYLVFIDTKFNNESSMFLRYILHIDSMVCQVCID